MTSNTRETEEEEKEREKKEKIKKDILCLSEKERRYSNGAPCLYIVRHGMKKEDGMEAKMARKTSLFHL